MKKWLVDVNGVRSGPLDSAELRRKVAAGEVGADDLVWAEGMTDWQPAAEALEQDSTAPVASNGRDMRGSPAAPFAAAAPVLSYAPPRVMQGHFAGRNKGDGEE